MLLIFTENKICQFFVKFVIAKDSSAFFIMFFSMEFLHRKDLQEQESNGKSKYIIYTIDMMANLNGSQLQK